MQFKALVLLSLLSPLTSCATSTTHNSTQANSPIAFDAVELSEEARQELFGTVAALEGNWSSDDGGTSQFEVTSGGSAVREITFAGQPHEMTNMYTLDGNGLNMTHYCAVGNQPHMRATTLKDSSLVFSRTGVTGRQNAEENYMGAMTLTIVDADTIQQTWTSYQGDQAGEQMIFTFMRTD
ncbi:MAG: hypothetical protein ACI87O_001881 [Planctomycetota bacterium]|jgi:hypothetical protein